MKIGLSQRVLYHKGRAYDSIEHGWYHYLKDHTLSCISNRLDQDFNNLAQELDAFIITGGDDSDLRRVVELKLCKAMMIRCKPVVGVCHGCFLLTELLKGKVGIVSDHMDIEHPIIYQGQKFIVNSYHNLCIDVAPPLSQGLAYDEHGRCESWIDRRTAGLVWHPERMQTPFLPVEISSLLEL